MSLAEQLQGRYIVFDGPDGTGKSTQLAMLKDRLEAEGASVEVAIDPGGTPTGQRIREILLGRDSEDISPVCETFLFMASRAQLVYEKVRPALAAGKVVLGDRFISATLAYQRALGIDPSQILLLGYKAVGQTWPDLTLILDLDVAEGAMRAGAHHVAPKSKGKAKAANGQYSLFGDRMESRALDYHERVRRNFHTLDAPGAYPRPVCLIPAEGTPKEIHQRILDALQERFGHD